MTHVLPATAGQLPAGVDAPDSAPVGDHLEPHIDLMDLVQNLGHLSYLIPRVVAEIQIGSIDPDRWDELRGVLFDVLREIPTVHIVING